MRKPLTPMGLHQKTFNSSRVSDVARIYNHKLSPTKASKIPLDDNNANTEDINSLLVQKRPPIGRETGIQK
jgi:hypothetical protein